MSAGIAFLAATLGLAAGFHWLWGAANHPEPSTRIAGWAAVGLLMTAAVALAYGFLAA